MPSFETQTRDEWIRARALQLADEALPTHPVVWNDTTNYMSIERNQVVDIQGSLFLVRCSEREGRFGIDDQPKFWVKRALDLETGRMHILKLAFEEAFNARVGAFETRCFRSSEKEGQVLDLVRGDSRFMQGHTTCDSRGNLVRIIDFISGVDLLHHLRSLPIGHEEYAHTLLPGILRRVVRSLDGIQRLHDAGLCHGDIRNDHLLIERETGFYKWIDFDLNEDLPAFDVWSTGNILHCVLGKGFVTFHEAVHAQPALSGHLADEDASVFFPSRVMNLRKVYPYLPDGFNEVLRRFSFGARVPYERISQITGDLNACAASLGWPRADL